MSAKIAIKKGKIQPGDDVLPRYLAGSTYSNRVLRNKRSTGGVKKRGKKKIDRLSTAVAIDKHGYTIGGWSA